MGGDVLSRLEYYHKDHLGNVRLTFSDLNQDGAITVGSIYDPTNEIVFEKHYYPFGLEMTGTWFATVAPDIAYRYSSGCNGAHDIAIGAENRVNNSTREDSSVYLPHATDQFYTRGNNAVTTRIQFSQNGGFLNLFTEKREVISVTNFRR